RRERTEDAPEAAVDGGVDAGYHAAADAEFELHFLRRERAEIEVAELEVAVEEIARAERGVAHQGQLRGGARAGAGGAVAVAEACHLASAVGLDRQAAAVIGSGGDMRRIGGRRLACPRQRQRE